MKKSIRQLTALLLGVCLSLSLYSVRAWAAQPSAEAALPAQEPTPAGDELLTPQTDLLDSGSCGERTSYELDRNGNLIIKPSASGYAAVTKHFGDDRIRNVQLLGINEVGDNVFNGCASMQSLLLQKGLVRIGKNAFAGCTNLRGLLSGAEFVPLNCPSTLTTIDDFAFRGCAKLSAVNLNDGLTRIGDHAFAECTGLSRMTIPGSVTTVADYAFWSSGLKSLTLSGGVQSLGQFAFADCTALTNTALPGSLGTVPTRCFSGCTALSSVRMNKGITTISLSAFQDCTRLQSVELPDGLRTVDLSAFENCPALKSVTVPDSVRTLDTWCFGYRDMDTKVTGFTLSAKDGTAAERYASANGFKFVDLSAVPKTALTGVKAGGKGVLNCTWKKNSAGKGYQLQCATDKGFKKNLTTKTVRSQSTVKASFTGLRKGSYYVRIRTIGQSSGRYSAWSGAVSVKLTKGFDLFPTTLSSLKAGKGSIAVNWKKNGSGKGYQLQYTADKGFKKQVKTIKIGKNTTVKYTLRGLKKGTTQYVRLRAVNGKKVSAWSEVKKAKVA